MRLLLLTLLVALALAGEALTPEQQRQHEAWLEAMRQSQSVGKPGEQPAASRPTTDPKSTPEYQASEAANRDAEAKRLRDEQARWKADREAREKADAETRQKRDAEEAARWAEIRARKDQEALDEASRRQEEARGAQAAAEKLAQEKKSKERWEMVWGIAMLIIVVPLALVLIALPGIIADWRKIPQRWSVNGLALCAIITAIASVKFHGLDTAAILLWSAALALSLWRFESS